MLGPAMSCTSSSGAAGFILALARNSLQPPSALARNSLVRYERADAQFDPCAVKLTAGAWPFGRLTPALGVCKVWPKECNRKSQKEEESMRNLRELESRIVAELRDLRGLEFKLDQRFAGLGAASSGGRL